MDNESHPLIFTEPTSIEYWDTLYDQKDFYGDCYRQRMSIVLSWLDDLNLPENSRILDIGCGAGRFTREAARRGYDVFGMDSSHGMIIKASSICNIKDELNVAFLQGNIEALPLQTSSLDVIVCLGVVAYLKSEEKALNSLARALKPGGILTISIVNKARLAYHLDLLFFLMSIAKKTIKRIAAFRKKGNAINDTTPFTTYFIPKFQRSLEQAGFCVVEYKTVPWKLLSLCGKELFPQKMATKITLFIEQFQNIPVVGSFGGMCVFKAKKLCDVIKSVD
jgi:2-polyprenyl-3-methyl-5-hydroxy-6-metoxy-1,4-benzoquinol methylase